MKKQVAKRNSIFSRINPGLIFIYAIGLAFVGLHLKNLFIGSV